MTVRRIFFTVAACLIALRLTAQAPAGAPTLYRVSIDMQSAEDGALVAKRLAAMYRGTLEAPVDGDSSFTISLSAAVRTKIEGLTRV